MMQTFVKVFLLEVQKQFLGFEKFDSENDLDIPDNNNNLSPIFIVGAPRSGSSILWQLIAKYYRIVYISNFMALFPSRMSKIFCLTWQSILNYNKIKHSQYGYISGLNSPNEAGALMDLWFDNKLNQHQILSIRNTVARISKMAKSPFVFKNLNNSIRIENILKIFPDAKFIYLKRNYKDNVKSLLNARKQIHNDLSKWWSVTPKNWKRISMKSPEEQVDWQIKQINNQIELDLWAKNNPQWIKINYENLCVHTEDCLSYIASEFDLISKKIRFDKRDIDSEKIVQK